MEKFRPVVDIAEIKSILGKGAQSDFGIIWQTLQNQDRQVYTITAIDVNDNEATFYTEGHFDFNQAYPIFVKLHNRNLIFKLTLGEYQLNKGQLVCRYPKEAQGIEERIQERTKIPKNVTLYLTLRTLSLGSMTEAKVRLLDVSESGLGVLIEKGSEDFFLNSRHKKETKFLFQLVKVGSITHVEKAQLELKHVTQQKQLKGLKAGFLLNLPLSDEFYVVLRKELKKNPKR